MHKNQQIKKKKQQSVQQMWQIGVQDMENENVSKSPSLSWNEIKEIKKINNEANYSWK